MFFNCDWKFDALFNLIPALELVQADFIPNNVPTEPITLFGPNHIVVLYLLNHLARSDLCLSPIILQLNDFKFQVSS